MAPSPRRRRALVATVLVLLVCPYLALAVAARSLGVADVKATQVAVRVDHLTGETEIVDRPGYQLFVPWIQDVVRLDKRPVEFLMSGDLRRGANEVPFLTVRSRDGSNFWFESLEIQYRLLPQRADVVLADSGPGDAYKRKWMNSFARAILRDEFGRYRAEEIADPTTYEEARVESERRLNEALVPHGVALIGIVTPKPRFDAAYEKAIDDRKVTEEEVLRLRGEVAQLEREREMRLAQTRKEKQIARVRLLGELDVERTELESKREREAAEAEVFALETVQSAESERDGLVALAESTRARARQEAEVLTRRARDHAAAGDVVVREALVEKLKSVNLRIAVRDAADAGGAR